MPTSNGLFANPKLILLLIVVVIFATYIKLSNPYRAYSSEAYWESATVEDVYAIPEEALQPGNRNGSVLMWAAMATNNAKVIDALIKRGADVNEEDPLFSGTPLSAAAASSSTISVIDALVRHGAEINKVVGSNDKTPLIIGAELNSNAQIIKRLVHHGAEVAYKDLTGRTALEQAIRFKNVNAETALRALSE